VRERLGGERGWVRERPWRRENMGERERDWGGVRGRVLRLAAQPLAASSLYSLYPLLHSCFVSTLACILCIRSCIYSLYPLFPTLLSHPFSHTLFHLLLRFPIQKRTNTTSGEVRVDFVYTRLDTELGNLAWSPVYKGTAKEFCSKAQQHIDWGCAHRPPPGRGLCL
jgi:hypothetical protein